MYESALNALEIASATRLEEFSGATRQPPASNELHARTAARSAGRSWGTLVPAAN